MPVATQKRSTARLSRRSDSTPFHYDSGGRSTGTYGPQPAPSIDEAALHIPVLPNHTDSAASSERLGTRASRKVRRHRPLQMNLISLATSLFLLGQLVALLWLHGRALSAAHRANDLDLQIAERRNAIARTQEKIAAYDASPRIAQWANERGWRPALQTDFDDVTSNAPMPGSAVAQNGDAPQATTDGSETTSGTETAGGTESASGTESTPPAENAAGGEAR